MTELGGSSYYPVKEPSKEDKYWAMGAHLGVIAAHWMAGMGFLVPLIVWAVKKDESEYIAKNSLQSLAFNIGCGVLFIILGFLGIITCGLGWMLLPVVYVLNVVYAIVAAIIANEGRIYEYPVTAKYVPRSQEGVAQPQAGSPQPPRFSEDIPIQPGEPHTPPPPPPPAPAEERKAEGDIPPPPPPPASPPPEAPPADDEGRRE